jgi:hypothetical protein
MASEALTRQPSPPRPSALDRQHIKQLLHGRERGDCLLCLRPLGGQICGVLSIRLLGTGELSSQGLDMGLEIGDLALQHLDEHEVRSGFARGSHRLCARGSHRWFGSLGTWMRARPSLPRLLGHFPRIARYHRLGRASQPFSQASSIAAHPCAQGSHGVCVSTVKEAFSNA